MVQQVHWSKEVLRMKIVYEDEQNDAVMGMST
jgi:hypothetical protein